VRANKEFAKAIALAPENLELKLRYAVALLGVGEKKRGTSVLRGALGRGEDAKALLRELSARGIVEEPMSDDG
jgi:predicted Zn-dependent protease